MQNIKCIDCLEFLKDIPDKSISLIITSPPYNIKKSYEKFQLSTEHYIEQQRKVIAECNRVLSDTGSIVWQIGNYVDNGEIIPIDIMLYPIFKENDLLLRNRIIWTFGHGLHAKRRFSGRYEVALWFTKNTKNYTFNLDPVRIPQKYPNKKHYKGSKYGQLSSNPLGKSPGDVWDNIPNVKSNHVEKTIHPAQFPVELVERFVLSLTNSGDIVFDPYIGVGSTAIAAIKNNRIAYGCDIMQDYIDIALERIELFRCGFLKTREMGTPIHDPKKKG